MDTLTLNLSYNPQCSATQYENQTLLFILFFVLGFLVCKFFSYRKTTTNQINTQERDIQIQKETELKGYINEEYFFH